MPVLYCSLESLVFDVYSIESEIWTFGVVLWELFTFAQTMPYERELPNITVAQLRSYLSCGRRLNCAKLAPFPMYGLAIIIFVKQYCYRQELMSKCWSVNPQERPNFNRCQLVIRKTIASK
jgi:hypothetical protein